MARADVGWSYPISDGHYACSQSNYLIEAASGDLYYIFILEQNTDIYWTKSSDGGFTWNVPTLIDADTVFGLAVWYDQWSTATGDLIYITWVEATTDIIHFRTLDTSSDTLGTDTTVFDGASAAGGTNQCLSITKAVGGNLYIAFDMDGGTETGFYRSTDAGANWTVRADLNEATSDYYLLSPDFAADTQDIMAFYWDRDADEISLKRYDDSGDSWATTAEASIATSMADVAPSTSTFSPQFSIVVDRANSRIALTAWSNADTANADLRFFIIDASTITESATNVVLNSTDDQAGCVVGLATDTGDFYVFYGGKSDGSETYGPSNAMNIYYKVTTDDGATWGAETLLTTFTRSLQYLNISPRFTGTDFYVLMGGVSALTPSVATFVSVPVPEAGGDTTVIPNLQITQYIVDPDWC